MSYLFLIPISIALGLTGLGAFFWSMRHDQYDDLQGAASRILITPDQPLPPPPAPKSPDERPGGRA
ncbi:cbb3-type cytochrome oxidase assembly protein CcoS [Frigidibacter sp.]|uniref:cbb3-type cytochrome oxidase assembly protein CcoS n=1 Tax=Frigidibacter sp. TaxID=2586418 RepID=UPI0027341356|nr:cbb3-type cytochrome oxidase assembly protein CcoS [Frigidibacter sp.]MDP3342250.1 cbb3-type cytochrome oxidase assembly protein CcoS [Frigidibacter sp.]